MSLEVTHSVQTERQSRTGDFQANNNSQPLIIPLSTTAVTYLAKGSQDDLTSHLVNYN